MSDHRSPPRAPRRLPVRAATVITVDISGTREFAAASISWRTRSGGGIVRVLRGTLGGDALRATDAGTIPHFSACLRAAETVLWWCMTMAGDVPALIRSP